MLPHPIKKRILRCFFPVLFILLLACTLTAPAGETAATSESTPLPSPAGTPTSSPTVPPYANIRRVIIVSVDGLRPEGLLRAEIPNFSRAINGGASSFSAQTVYLSSTLPGHASMLSGRCIPNHGITWNDYLPEEGYLEGPTVFSVAHDAGLRTAMVVSKEKLVTLARPGTVDSFQYASDSDEHIVEMALEEADSDFGVLFVHLFLPDYVGHLQGWMSPAYIQVIGRDDAAFGTLLDGLEQRGLLEETLIVVTADHGGHDFTHGSTRPEDMTIPWLAFGPGIVEGLALPVPVSTTDTAATAVWALGLDLPAAWDGRPVVEAFGLDAGEAGVKPAEGPRCNP